MSEVAKFSVPLQKLKMMLFGASLIMVVGCSSKENALCHPQPKPPAPPAWAMMPPSNSLQLLDETFSVSGTESSATRQH
ncbi:Rz1 family lipoprotein [Escherichia coli]|nr:Rz1 family lipoprotein [Escherichia coli]ELY1437206.1 Rz1 family lipoprotein [Escherichia coli]